MEKNDEERAAMAAYYIGRAIYELEEIELKEHESQEVKTELYSAICSLLDLEVEVGGLADRFRI